MAVLTGLFDMGAPVGYEGVIRDLLKIDSKSNYFSFYSSTTSVFGFSVTGAKSSNLFPNVGGSLDWSQSLI